MSRSASNLAVWTPMTTSSFLYFSSSLARSGRTWWQLMQQKVQKSSRTILPRSSASAIGPELIQPTPPSRLGRRSWLERVRAGPESESTGPAERTAPARRPTARPAIDEQHERRSDRRSAASGQRVRRAMRRHAGDLIVVAGRSESTARRAVHS